jgi:hypothetical protein
MFGSHISKSDTRNGEEGLSPLKFVRKIVRLWQCWSFPCHPMHRRCRQSHVPTHGAGRDSYAEGIPPVRRARSDIAFVSLDAIGLSSSPDQTTNLVTNIKFFSENGDCEIVRCSVIAFHVGSLKADII